MDPISDQFPHLSTYNYASNDPIANIDLHGLQGISAISGWLINKVTSFSSSATSITQSTNEYFNIKSLAQGTSEDKVQTLSRVHEASTTASKIKDAAFDVAENSLQSVREGADNVQLGALTATGLSGGTASPFTGPVVAGAEVVSTGALVLEGVVDYARDGKVDQTVGDFLLKVVFSGTAMTINKGVDALKIGDTLIPEHTSQTKDAVKSIGLIVNKTIQKTIKEKDEND